MDPKDLPVRRYEQQIVDTQHCLALACSSSTLPPPTASTTAPTTTSLATRKVVQLGPRFCQKLAK